MITIVLQGVQAHLSSRSLWAGWAGNTGDQVASFWNTYAFSPYFVDKTVTTRVYNTGRMGTTVPSPSSVNISNVTMIRPLFIQYTQQLFYGLVNHDQQSIDPLFLPTDEKIFTMPFTVDQKTYTDNLAKLLNNTVPIIVSSITISNATSLPPPSSAPPPSSSTITGQDRNIIIITTVITLFSLIVAGGYILYLTRKDDGENDDDDDNAERITVDGLPFDDSSEQYHEKEADAYYYYGGDGDGDGGARRERSLRGGEHGYSTSGGSGDHPPPPPPGVPPNPTYTGTSSATLTSARSSGQPSHAQEPNPPNVPLDSFHQRGRTSSGSHLAPSLVYGGTGSNGSQTAAAAAGSEMDYGGSSVSTGGRGRDAMSGGGGGAGSWTVRDENGGGGGGPSTFSNPNYNSSYPTISTLPISVIRGEGGGGGNGGNGPSSAYRGMRGEPGLDVADGENHDYSPSNDIYGNYLHHHRPPRLSDADMQTLPTIPSMSDTREVEFDGDGPHAYQHNHQLDEQGSRNHNDLPPPPHLMSGFQLTIEDLDDM